MADQELVPWDPRLLTGIPSIDEQHKVLVEICNELFKGCLLGGEEANAYFRAAIKKAVDYVKMHFAHEEGILAAYAYPALAEHRLRHEEFIREVLKQAGAFNRGEKFVPNHFARYLRDWTLEHIAISDHEYAEFLRARGAR